MNEVEIKAFWNKNPCGDYQVGGLQERNKANYEAFFKEYDKFRYWEEKYILRCLDDINFREKRVLEIGLGQGADSEQIIRRGAMWSGLDLTAESIERVQTRLSLRKLPHQSLMQGTIVNAPFEDDSFDIVYSFGVLHHVPDIQTAQREIARMLKPDGELIIMVYAKWSLNYLLSIQILRRLGLIGLYAARYAPSGVYGQHLANARVAGLGRYLQMKNFIHRNTDGPLNPYSKVYDVAEVRRDFPDFKVVRSYKRFMHAPPLPVRWLPLESVLGWHLWVHLKPT